MSLFARARVARPKIIGMIHTRPLPGSPDWDGNMARVLEEALADAAVYRATGVDAVLIENMNDVPYLRGRVEPETTAAMAVVASAVKRALAGLPVGVQLLAAANREALGVALAAGLDFVRVEAFAYAHVADEGLLQACAGDLVRTRAGLLAQGIELLADIKKKHASHALTGDLSLVETAHGTEFCRADGLIITGTATGRPPRAEDVREVRTHTQLPVLVGSGVTAENLDAFVHADGLIVGSYFKCDGRWEYPVDGDRVRTLLRALERA